MYRWRQHFQTHDFAKRLQSVAAAKHFCKLMFLHLFKSNSATIVFENMLLQSVAADSISENVLFQYDSARK